MSRSIRALVALAVAACLAAAPLGVARVADEALVVPSLDSRHLRQEVDLATATWLRNGEPSTAATAGGPPERAVVALPFDGMGVRWSTTFETPTAASVRLGLDWLAGPDGLLVEIMLDGQVLRPVRDAWRPTERPLRTDLGPFWLGRGEHLLEFIARERVTDGVLRLARFEIRDP